LPGNEFEAKEFGNFMRKLEREQKLGIMARFDSTHFTAWSNADDQFTIRRLHNCELIYDIFFEHFRKKGFVMRKPGTKLMVAVFDTQAGFEAYLGEKMPATVAGIYPPGTNRLVIYDLGQNEAFVASKRFMISQSRRIHSDMDRMRYVDTVNRLAHEFRTEANIGVTMHEVAHQLSFNNGMINREGDVPRWL